ncbi:hypothetical protein ACFX2G_047817 [Malus domestica]
MKSVAIRRVWQRNAAFEFHLITALIRHYTFVSLDTEFPGTVFQIPAQTPASKYHLMRENVNATKIIQLGLTLSDRHGNLPDLGTDTCYIWEFNFRDFDIDRDCQNKDSIELLKRQGIDFLENKQNGISASHFSSLLRNSGLISRESNLTWVTFHSAYDFGFLIKILNEVLPHDITSFMWMMDLYFGQRVYDIKYMIRFCQGLHGGLEKVANALNVDRVAGKSHQAGSDSLLTLQTFMKLKDVYFKTSLLEQNCNSNFYCCQGVLYGLEVEDR